MLRILKASEPLTVEQIVVTIYAAPGLGKTSTGYTADSPLLLDFDQGAYRAANRGDTVPVKSWSDVSAITADDLKPYKTLVMDTAGRALDHLAADIITANPKMGRGGALTLQGFGELKAKFIAYTKLIRSFGLDIVLLVHADEQKSGDDIIERLDAQGGSKNEIYKVSDLMGRLKIETGKRMLNFSPTDTAFGKNPAGFPKIEVPDFATAPRFLAEIIGQTKASLNRQTEAKKKTASMMADWQAKFDGLTTVDEINAAIPDAAKADEAVRDNVKRLLVKRGKALGFEFDKKAAAFKQPEQAAA
jgi:hypothetical protein